MVDSLISANSAHRNMGGLGLEFNDYARVENTVIESNKARLQGGGIWVGRDSNVTLIKTEVLRNQAGGDAGGVCLDGGGALWVSAGSTISDNIAIGHGGGIEARPGSVLYLMESEVNNNSANDGAGLWANANTVVANTSNLTRNTAVSSGGGLFIAKAKVQLGPQLVIRANSVGSLGGGLLARDASLLLATESKFIDNKAPQGGGLYLLDSTGATLIDCLVQDNVASSRAGGLFADAGCALEVQGGHFRGNMAKHTNTQHGQGGALAVFTSHFSLSQVNFTRNVAGFQGGAVYHSVDCPDPSQAPTLSAVGFDQNTAVSGGGGAVFFRDTRCSRDCPVCLRGPAVFARNGTTTHEESVADNDTVSSGCFCQDNVATYGADFASGPVALLAPRHVSVSFRRPFELVATLVDAWGSPVMGWATLDQSFARLSLQPGVAFNTSLVPSSIQQAINHTNGQAAFTELYLKGRINSLAVAVLQYFYSSREQAAAVSNSTNFTIAGCGPGYVPNADQTECNTCPFGTYGGGQLAVCLPCPLGALCPDPAFPPLASQEHWEDLSVHSSVAFKRCWPGYCCRNGTHGCKADRPTDPQLVWDTRVCAPHRTGVLCGDCLSGYFSKGLEGDCIACERTDSGLVTGYTLALIALSIFFLKPESRGTFSGTKAVLIFFIQNVPIVSSEDFVGVVINFFSFALPVSSDKESGRCLPISQLTYTLFPFYATLAVLGVFCFIYLCALATLRCCTLCSSPKGEKCKLVVNKVFSPSPYGATGGTTSVQTYRSLDQVMLTGLLHCFLFVFTPLTQACLHLVNCQEVGGTKVLTAAPTITCWERPHLGWGVFAIVFLCTFCTTVPVFVMRKALEYDLVYQEISADKYQPNYARYVLVDLARRFILIAIAQLAFAPGYKVLCTCVVLAIFLLISERRLPYLEPIDNHLEIVVLYGLLLLVAAEAKMFTALHIKVPNVACFFGQSEITR
eukprot:g68826.t1